MLHNVTMHMLLCIWVILYKGILWHISNIDITSFLGITSKEFMIWILKEKRTYLTVKKSSFVIAYFNHSICVYWALLNCQAQLQGLKIQIQMHIAQ